MAVTVAKGTMLTRGFSMSEMALKLQIRWLVLIFCLSFWLAVAYWAF